MAPEPNQHVAPSYTAGSHDRALDDRLPAGARRCSGARGGRRAAVPRGGRGLRRRVPRRVRVLHAVGLPDHQPAACTSTTATAPSPSARSTRGACGGCCRRAPLCLGAIVGDRDADRRVRRRHRPPSADRRLDPPGGELGVPRGRRLVPADLPADGRDTVAARALLVARDRGAVLLGVAADDGPAARPAAQPPRPNRSALAAVTAVFAAAAPVIAVVWGADAAYWATPARIAEILRRCALLAVVLAGREVPARVAWLAPAALARSPCAWCCSRRRAGRRTRAGCPSSPSARRRWCSGSRHPARCAARCRCRRSCGSARSATACTCTTGRSS